MCHGRGLANPVQRAGLSQNDPALSFAEHFEQHCTVMYAADDQVALGGNNEDNYYAVPTAPGWPFWVSTGSWP